MPHCTYFPPEAPTLDAGDFIEWLGRFLTSLSSGAGMTVECGDCRACCRAGFFIPVGPEEASSRKAIPSQLLVDAAGAGSPGHQLVAITPSGDCALLRGNECSIYASRPRACREYDCRLFAAAGISAGIEAIDRQARRWRFRYADAASERAHQATRAAAAFLREHRSAFPGGRAPDRPADIALVAAKAHHVFLAPDGAAAPQAIARQVIEACRQFEATV